MSEPSLFFKLSLENRIDLYSSGNVALVANIFTMSKLDGNEGSVAQVHSITDDLASELGHVTIRDAELEVGLSREYLQELCLLGEIEAVEHNGVWLIDRHSLANHMFEKTRQFASKPKAPRRVPGKETVFFPQLFKQNVESKLIDLSEGRISTSNICKILFLGANPMDTVRLRLDNEIRSIEQALNQSPSAINFHFEKCLAVRVTDIQRYLLQHKPRIVHFSGHGHISNEIILENESGHAQPVSAETISRLFSILKDNIQCVLLNSCYSEIQALAIANHIDVVIGMGSDIEDNAAINFVTAFYQALAFGRDVKTAFDLGCLQINMQGHEKPHIPKIVSLRKDPSKVYMVQNNK